MEKPSCDANTVFIDTNLNTHLALIVSYSDTVSDLKRKILNEHPLCFPKIGDIKINAIKVKRRGHFYHLSDLMLVRSAFEGINRCWFLSVDASTSGQPIEGQLLMDIDSSNQLTCKGVMTNLLENGIDDLPGGPTKRDVSKGNELEGQLANGDGCQQSILDTNKTLVPEVEEANTSGREDKITQTEDDGKSLTASSNKNSVPLEDDTDDVIKGDEVSRKDSVTEASNIKTNVFGTVVDSQSKRSLDVEAPQSSRPAKKRRIERKSKASSKESKSLLIESKKEASEIDDTVLQRSSKNYQKSEDPKGKIKKREKSSKPHDFQVPAVLSSEDAGILHEDAHREPDAALLTEGDVQGEVQIAVGSHGFTDDSKQYNPVKQIGIKSSKSENVERNSAYAVEEIQSLNDDGVINGRGQPPADIGDNNNQSLQPRASKNEDVIHNNNSNNVSNQIDDFGEERVVLNETELRSSVASMLSLSTHEEGKPHFENPVVASRISDTSETAGHKEIKKKKKKAKGTKKSGEEVKIATVPQIGDSSAVVQSLNNDGVVNDKDVPSVQFEDAKNDNQQAGLPRDENVILNSNHSSVSRDRDIEKERKSPEVNDHSSAAPEVPGPSTHEERKMHIEKPSETAGQKKSTQKRKKLKETRKLSEVTIAVEADGINSTVEEPNLNHGLINSKDQPSVDTIQITKSSSENVILTDEYNSVSHQMNNNGMEKDLSVKSDQLFMEKAADPVKISDATEMIGLKETTKKRKKRKEVKDSKEATVAAVTECIEGSTTKKNINVDRSDDKIRERESILSEPQVNDLSDSKIRGPMADNRELADIENNGVATTQKTRKSKENGENIVSKVKKTKKTKKRESSKNPPDVQIEGKHISDKDSDLPIKHADEEASAELTKKNNVAEKDFPSQSKGSSQEREKANAIDDVLHKTKKTSDNVELLVPSDPGNNEDCLQHGTDDTNAVGAKIDKEISCESNRINFRDYFVPKQNPNEAVTAVDEVTASVKPTKKNKKKRVVRSENASDFQALPRSNENQSGEAKPQIGESNSIQHDGFSSKHEQNEYKPNTSKKNSEDSVESVNVQASSNSNKCPSVGFKASKLIGDEYAVDLSNNEGFATPRTSLEFPKKVSKLSKKSNESATISPGKNNGEVVDGSDNEKRLAKLGTSVWDESSEYEDTTVDSDNSTETPSDINSQSHAHTDEESTAALDSPRTGDWNFKRRDSRGKSEKLRSRAQRGMSMDKILRSSSRYKRAKLTASQSEIEDTESQPVPDSQPNVLSQGA